MQNEHDRDALMNRITAHVEDLPPIPINIGRVLHEAAQAHRDDAKLKAIIREDPGLCADLLHQAACAVGDSSSARAAETVDEAVEQAGLDYLVDLVGASYFKQTIQDKFGSMQLLDEYFQHSREIAATCPILAGVLGLPRQQRQFYQTAGILHDIGRLVMRLAVGQRKACLRGTGPLEMAAVVHDEEAELGLNHCEVGKRICQKWGLADRLREGVERHHTPLIRPDDFSYPGSLLFLAHFVAGSDFSGQIISQFIPPVLFEKLGLTTDMFDEARRRYTSHGEFS